MQRLDPTRLIQTEAQSFNEIGWTADARHTAKRRQCFHRRRCWS